MNAASPARLRALNPNGRCHIDYAIMLIPLRTDRDAKRRPVITETLIAVNVLVFVAGYAGPHFGWFEQSDVWEWGWYSAAGSAHWPGLPQWARLFSYQFLHGGFWHIAFNMLFLWVFGSAVEDRFKRIGFLSFYLIGGAVAAILHGQSTLAPVIGASGSVAAVTGAFLALFPRSTIATIVFIYGIRHLPAVWLIGLYFTVDVLRWTMGLFTTAGMGIAHLAHIAGYVYGFSFAFTLLALRVIPRQEMDVFYMFSQWRRRRAFRAVTRESRGAAWDAPIRTGHEELASADRGPKEMTERERADAVERAEIAKLMADHDLAEAARRYRQLLSRDADVVLSEDRQLDIANQLAAESEHRDAAKAYELLLKIYPKSVKADEVRLILGMIYARRLGNGDRARELLEQAKRGLRDPKQVRFAEQLLAEM